MKKWSPLLLLVFFLSGCWDEQLFKNESIIQLVGYEGEPGEITGYYSYPVISKEKVEYTTVIGKGKSLHDVRIEANRQTHQLLDIAPLEVLLMSDETAKHDLYDYLDPFYRLPKNRLNARIVIVEGSIEKYINDDLQLTTNISNFYVDMVESFLFTSEVPDITLQKACTILFDDGIDLILPYLKINEESSKPELGGTALFSKSVYSGEHLTPEETVLLKVMQGQIDKDARQTFIWEHENEKYTIAVDIDKVKKKWDLKNEGDRLKLNATYKLKISIDELAKQNISKKETIKELEAFINKKLDDEMTKVLHKIQDAKSDALGIGRKVRAFHPRIWEKADWHDTYEKMEFDVHVESNIYSTGILQ